jgi:hypothetical protein
MKKIADIKSFTCVGVCARASGRVLNVYVYVCVNAYL